MTPANDLVTLEYDRNKAEVIRTVRAKLSAAGISAPDGDLDASYNEAWHALYLALAEGEEVENRIGFLVTVAHRRALNEFRALKVSRRADATEAEAIGIELDLDAQLDAQIQLRQIREGFRSKLSSRELEAATLCHLYGYTRPEAAEAMGVRPKRMEKIMDRASARIGSVVETVRSGEHCAELSPTIRAFALGVLDPDGEKYELATDHLAHCPACRNEVWTERGLAAIGPPLPLAFALLAGGAGAGGSIAGGLAVSGGKGGAAKGAAAAGKGTSAGRKAAIAGTAVAAVAAVAVAGAFAIGTVGGGSSDPEEGSPASLASGGGSGGAGGSAGSSANANGRAEARTAARRRAAQARRREAVRDRREAKVAAEASETESAAYVPEPTYVPPPAPVPVDPTPGEPVNPEPPVPAEPDPKPQPEPPKTVDAKPTTDAGEEFGLR